ncbi:MAG TPA: pyrroloquinoline quinone biosynthesis protein PqqB [Candidatus Binatia bacterium]|nr:pyrroloquinoline quinone biosynthesis protein PqqB [Candidatus Binatia bacterium]
MRVRVLGSSAGGGFPQWNCGCPNCRGIRASTIRAKPRSQECVAVSADGEHWYLLNASPDLRLQIEGFPALHPRGPRHSPIAGIVLTSGDLDHCLGLLLLRESQPLTVYATESVWRGVSQHNAFFRTLERFEGQVRWRRLECDGAETLLVLDGSRPSGLSMRAIAAPGKPPVHLEGIHVKHPEENIGLRIRDDTTGRVLAYVSGASAITDRVYRTLEDADCVFFDGTFWSATELVDLGLGRKRAEDMAHLPIGGEAGSLAALRALGARRRLFIHVNNTNPILREDSAEAAAVRGAGWEVAEDGMEIEL